LDIFFLVIMRRWRNKLPVLAPLFALWQIAAGGLAPVALRLAAASTTLPKTASAEVCEHHAMPGAMCPMHAPSRHDAPRDGACKMTACDSLTGELLTLMGSGGPLVNPIRVEAPSMSAASIALPIVLLLDFSPSPVFPPPRA